MLLLFVDRALLAKIALVAVALALTFCWAVLRFQDRLIYIPCGISESRNMGSNAHGYRYPSDRQLSYKNVYVKTDDGLLLHGWLIYRKRLPASPAIQRPVRDVKFFSSAATRGVSLSPPRAVGEVASELAQRNLDAERFGSRTVVFFHENSGNIGMRLKYFEDYIVELDCNLLVVAYRGYSLSEGTPFEAGLKADALTLFRWVFTEQSLFDPGRAIFHGRSLGAAVLLHALAHSPHATQASKVVFECAFTSLSDVVRTLFPRLGTLGRLLLRNRWDSLAEARRLPPQLQALFLAGARDELTPRAMSERLHAAANVRQKALVIGEGDHNQPFEADPRLYYDSIRRLMSL